ncbi:hypothetical protein HYH03_010549 [Edaphochlamys debaryana]|uniref:Uncharacterized protein n=1 Tax=Edaphochlamys debaryana TaxID=47281 RepID=A0A835Y205_9CHLO|nr:hypothetical protein HYH03_010549 [Edaphochlamys debaryana]|eukprot:KAG2491105.1 hypothetical protein HYH03_010549 [Edaphochlamys debaryana]
MSRPSAQAPEPASCRESNDKSQEQSGNGPKAPRGMGLLETVTLGGAIVVASFVLGGRVQGGLENFGCKTLQQAKNYSVKVALKEKEKGR